MDEKHIDFSNTVIENGNLAVGTGEIFETNEQLPRDVKVRVTGDTAWKLYYETHAEGKFGYFPPDMWQCWQHKEASSRNWYGQNKEAIEKMRHERRT